MPVINRIAAYSDEMKEWRQHIHQNPELGFDCHNTAAFVIERLKEFGVDEIHDGIATSGVVAIINGQGPGDTIGLRTDMDALPIQEVRDLPYKSKIEGKMHACGHDGHTTMLLGAAKYLSETRNFSGRVALIFQPAEEGFGGGRVMCEEGIMTQFGIAQVFAIHNWPGLETGAIAGRTGPIMAAADRFTLTVTGKGGHAAMPQASIDPIVVATQIVQAYQTIVSRNTSPFDRAVVSITQFHAGDAFNVIPDTVEITGTVRTFKPEVQEMVERRMSEIATHMAAAHGATAELNYMGGYPATVNHGAQLEFAADVARDLVGKDMVDTDVVPSMGGEDFAYMLQERPGAYLFLGQGDSPGLHHSEYDFKDEIAPIGASFFAKLVETAQPL